MRNFEFVKRILTNEDGIKRILPARIKEQEQIPYLTFLSRLRIP